MKRNLRILSIILSLLLIFSSVSMEAYAAQKLAAPKLTATSGLNFVNLKWKKVKNAKGYTVYQYNAKKKKFVKIKNVNKTTLKISKLSSGTTYGFTVKAYNKKKKYSKNSNKVYVSTLPSAVNGLNAVAAGTSSINVYWSNVNGATKYRLQYSESDKFVEAQSVDLSSNYYNVNSLKENTKYYFRVYAIKNYGGKALFSAVSNTVSAVTNKIPVPQPEPDIRVDTASKVHIEKKYQKIDGFGTSAAWWGHKVGGWESADKIIKYLYDPNDGIGLNIYRYNSGAGSRSDENLTSYWARTDSFVESYDAENKKFTYDFTKDAEAQNALAIAKRYAGDDLRLSIFANSPPVEITDNGKAYCSHTDEWDYKQMPSNLSVQNYPVYAQYMTDVADYFVDQGYRVCDISPVNEPQYSWCCGEDGKIGQEGCHYTPQQCSQLYTAFVNKISDKSYKVSMFESGAAEGEDTIFDDYLMTIMGSKKNSDYFRSVSTHSYWTDKATKAKCYEYVSNFFYDMDIACTEYCQMTNDSNTGVFDISSPIEWWNPERNGLGIEYGVQMARVIYEDMTVLNATEWNWWLGVSNGYYPDGLVYIDHEDVDHDFVETSKRLWCLGNYSKFIDEGAQRVAITEAQEDVLSSAYINPDGSLVIVYVNQTKDNKIVSPKVEGYNTISVYETSAEKDLERVNSGLFTNTNEVSLPSNSVVSVILTK